MAKTYSGYTDKTMKNLVLDSGAYFKNFVIGTDTFETAVTAGKLLGATRGGGTFNAKPTIRNIEVDGIKGRAKGLSVIDAWDVSIQANVIEVTIDTLKLSLGSSTVATSTEDADYDKIVANNVIAVGDYIDNITWVGTLSGSNEPVIIQVYNALNTDGLSLQPQSKGEIVMAMTFYGHYDQTDLDSPPFAIFYPKLV